MNVKNIVCFAAGALFGGALGAYLMKDKYEKEARDAIQSVKDFYKELSMDEQPKKEEKAEEKPEEPVDPRPNPATVAKEEYFMEDEPNEKPDIEEPEENDIPEQIDVIDEYSFNEECPQHGKEHYYYYLGDHTLVDEEYEPIIDPDTYVGNDIHLKFERQMGQWDDAEPIYLRNRVLGIDIEITPVTGDFYGGEYN